MRQVDRVWKVRGWRIGFSTWTYHSWAFGITGSKTNLLVLAFGRTIELAWEYNPDPTVWLE